MDPKKPLLAAWLDVTAQSNKYHVDHRDGRDGSDRGSVDGRVPPATSDGVQRHRRQRRRRRRRALSAAAGRYYPGAGMRRLPGAVQGRRRRAAVLQGARLQRVRERGRGDRHVPVLRRGPVAGGLFQRRAIAVAGGLLERRGDRARAVEGWARKATQKRQ